MRIRNVLQRTAHMGLFAPLVRSQTDIETRGLSTVCFALRRLRCVVLDSHMRISDRCELCGVPTRR